MWLCFIVTGKVSLELLNVFRLPLVSIKFVAILSLSHSYFVSYPVLRLEAVLQKQLLGVLDVLQGFVPIHEASYLREANTTPSSPSSSPHQSPSLLPLLDGISRRRRTSGFSQVEVSASLHLLVALLSDGTVVLCSSSEKGLRQASDINPERWVGVFDAVCASIAQEQQILAVGTRRGTVEMFNLADSASLLRTISLFDWGSVCIPS